MMIEPDSIGKMIFDLLWAICSISEPVACHLPRLCGIEYERSPCTFRGHIKIIFWDQVHVDYVLCSGYMYNKYVYLYIVLYSRMHAPMQTRAQEYVHIYIHISVCVSDHLHI